MYRRRRFEAEIIELDAAGVLNVEYSQGNDAHAYLSIVLHRSSSRWRTFSTLVAEAQAGQAISLMDEPIVFYKLAHGGTNASPAGVNRRHSWDPSQTSIACGSGVTLAAQERLITRPQQVAARGYLTRTRHRECRNLVNRFPADYPGSFGIIRLQFVPDFPIQISCNG